MAKYHINAKGVPALCRAKKGNCPFGGSESHFETKEEAQVASNKINEENFGMFLQPSKESEAVQEMKELIDKGEISKLMKRVEKAKSKDIERISVILDNKDKNEIKNAIEKRLLSLQKERELIEEDAIELKNELRKKQVEKFSKEIPELKNKIKKLESQLKSEKILVEENNKINCSQCDSPMELKNGVYGKYLACSNFPKCSNTDNVKSLSQESIKKESLISEYKSQIKTREMFINKIDFNDGEKAYTEDMDIARRHLLNDEKEAKEDLRYTKNMKSVIMSLNKRVESAKVKEKIAPYRAAFRMNPYIEDSTLMKNFKDMQFIEKEINLRLKENTGFKGIQFSEVAGEITIKGYHKDIEGYYYGEKITIKSDFSNKEEAIQEFEKMWKSVDQKDNLKEQQEFIDYSSLYDWD